jgi:6-phosphogluconolactonase
LQIGRAQQIGDNDQHCAKHDEAAPIGTGHQHQQDELVHAVYNSPKPPPERVSISAKALSDSREVIFLITGANKQEAVNLWRSGHDLPVASIVPENPIDIYIDRDAFKP